LKKKKHQQLQQQQQQQQQQQLATDPVKWHLRDLEIIKKIQQSTISKSIGKTLIYIGASFPLSFFP